MVTATCPVYIYAAVKLLKKCRKGNANCALKNKWQHFVTKWNAKIIQPLCNDTVEDYTEASSKRTDRFHVKLRWAQEITTIICTRIPLLLLCDTCKNVGVKIALFLIMEKTYKKPSQQQQFLCTTWKRHQQNSYDTIYWDDHVTVSIPGC